MTLSDEGIALIKRFEGFRREAYRDAAGVWTIGYGHTGRAAPPPVTPGMTITPEEGEAILKADLEVFIAEISPLIETGLTANQFSALVSFAFNVGSANFARSSVLRAVNEGRLDDVPGRLALWNKAGGRVLRGLVRRRMAEGELFMTPDGAGEGGSPGGLLGWLVRLFSGLSGGGGARGGSSKGAGS